MLHGFNFSKLVFLVNTSFYDTQTPENITFLNTRDLYSVGVRRTPN